MKNFKDFMESTDPVAKKCPKGKYYCFTDKKCKKIPTGYRIGYGGRLAPDNRSDSGDDKKMEMVMETVMGMVEMEMVEMVEATAVETAVEETAVVEVSNG